MDDFTKGYTRAIMDTCKIFNSIQSDLSRYHKQLGYKDALEILALILKNREAIREGRGAAIGYSAAKGHFEFRKGDDSSEE